jgi:hypothetical protein
MFDLVKLWFHQQRKCCGSHLAGLASSPEIGTMTIKEIEVAIGSDVECGYNGRKRGWAAFSQFLA